MQLHITVAEKPEEKQRPRSREGFMSPVHKFYLQDFKSSWQLRWFFLFCFVLVFFFASVKEGQSQGKAEW